MAIINEIAPTIDRREMRMGRAVFLMIATLLLWCGSMLLILDVAANASGTHGQVALIGLVLVAIGSSCLWADYFEVTSWFASERWVTSDVPYKIPAAFMPQVLHKRGAFVEQGNSQAGDVDEGRVITNSEALVAVEPDGDVHDEAVSHEEAPVRRAGASR